MANLSNNIPGLGDLSRAMWLVRQLDEALACLDAPGAFRGIPEAEVEAVRVPLERARLAAANLLRTVQTWRPE